LTETYAAEKVEEMLGDIIKSCYDKAQEQQKAEGDIKLELFSHSLAWCRCAFPFALSLGW